MLCIHQAIEGTGIADPGDRSCSHGTSVRNEAMHAAKETRRDQQLRSPPITAGTVKFLTMEMDLSLGVVVRFKT